MRISVPKAGFVLLLTLPFYAFCQSEKNGKSYLQLGAELEGSKHFGGKLNFGMASQNKEGNRSLAAGIGIEAISYSGEEKSTLATPIYLDIKQFITLKSISLFLSVNPGYYGYKHSENYTLNLGNGESVKAEGATKGQAFIGINAGSILPFKGKKYNGVYLSIGYRHVQFQTKVTTTTVTKNRNGNGYQTTTRSSNLSTGSDYLHISLGISI